MKNYHLCRMYTAPPSQQVGPTRLWTPLVVRGMLYTSDIGDNLSYCMVGRKSWIVDSVGYSQEPKFWSM
jgi:hypothetical protein